MKNRAFIYLFIVMLISTSYASEVKDADLAGSWYPASKPQLENQLKGYLDAAGPEKIDGKIFVLIVPHAGYVYSGPVAAEGYKAAQDRGIKVVIILGFSHRRFFDGIAIYDKGSWRTPLGEIQIDEALAKEMISKNSRISFNPGLFISENSVEMQVPFIQAALGKMRQPPAAPGEAAAPGTVPVFPKIVPILFGTQDYKDAESLAATLAEIVKDRDDILVVASTDMSHYHSYDDANSIDKHTMNILNRLDAGELYNEGKIGACELCGLMPVTTSLLAARMSGCDKIKTLKYTNSGDITGDKAKVVGYLSSVIYKEAAASQGSAFDFAQGRPFDTAQGRRAAGKDEAGMLSEAQRKRLLRIARESITSFVKNGKRKAFIEPDGVLNQPMGAFVTLHENGQLRGCIGNMVSSGPLYQTIADMAIEAATGDPRFQRLSAAEIDKIEIEISVLSPLLKVKSADEINIPGHGVIVKRGFNSGVYLPQVADETGWSKEEFLTSLCAHKAGLAPDAWKNPTTEMYTFTAEVFGEGGK